MVSWKGWTLIDTRLLWLIVVICISVLGCSTIGAEPLDVPADSDTHDEDYPFIPDDIVRATIRRGTGSATSRISVPVDLDYVTISRAPTLKISPPTTPYISPSVRVRFPTDSPTPSTPHRQTPSSKFPISTPTTPCCVFNSTPKPNNNSNLPILRDNSSSPNTLYYTLAGAFGGLVVSSLLCWFFIPWIRCRPTGTYGAPRIHSASGKSRDRSLSRVMNHSSQASAGPNRSMVSRGSSALKPSNRSRRSSSRSGYPSSSSNLNNLSATSASPISSTVRSKTYGPSPSRRNFVRRYPQQQSLLPPLVSSASRSFAKTPRSASIY